VGQAHARDFGSDQRGRALLGWGARRAAQPWGGLWDGKLPPLRGRLMDCCGRVNSDGGTLCCHDPKRASRS
jgi:hypothetical protein